MIVIFFNLVALIAALFFSDEFSNRAKLGLVAYFAGAYYLPGLISDTTTGSVVFMVAQLALAIFLCFKLGVGHRRAYA